MSSGSSPTTYIPEPAAPTVTRSVTPQQDYQYASDVMDQLEAERKAIEKRTLSELTARRSELGAKEDKSYRESLATDEPDYTEGLDPYQLNTIASQVYGGAAAAALQDLATRRSREYVAVAGANPMAPPPTPAPPTPVVLPQIPANLFTPPPAPAPPPPAPSGPVGRMTETPKYQSQLLAVPGMTTKTKPSGKTVFISTDPSQNQKLNRLKGQWHIDKMREQGKSQEYIDNFKRQSAWMFK